MKLKIKTNKVFRHLENSKKFITIEQGGSRSGKTFNILIWLVITALKTPKLQIDVVRKTLPTLKASAYRDFLEIIERMNIFDLFEINKTELTYKLPNGSQFNFYSLDQSQKVRGRKRDIVFINEANDTLLEDFRQLAFRTTKKIILDYNPSDEISYIYDKIIVRKDSELFITTYKDNPFLDKRLIEEIERLQFEDENYWNIYGLGQRGQRKELVYNNYIYLDNFENIEFEEEIFGLDFGFNNPTTLIKIGLKDKEFYESEMLYQSYMTNSDLIEWLNQNLSHKEKSLLFYADAAEPQRIQELNNAGYNVLAADKSVKDGIDFCKRFKTYARNCDVNNLKEIKSYSWKRDRQDRILEEPIKFNDHLRDASRYAKYTHYKELFGLNFKNKSDEFQTFDEIFIDKDLGEF